MPKPLIVAARLKQNSQIFICGKCAKRTDGGKGIVRALKDELKTQAGIKRKMIRVSCFGLCPKNAVVIASASTLLDARVLIVRPNAEPTSVLDRLDEQSPPQALPRQR